MVSTTARNPPPEVSLAESSTPAGRGLKALIAIAAVYGAFAAFQFSYFSWKRTSDSAAVYAAHPEDPAALAEHVLRKIAADPAYRPSEEDAQRARASLVRAPLTTMSLWIIGMAAHESGDIAEADATMALADRVSKRDIMAQLWLIERSVEKDDVKAAIRHYHAALSVDTRLEETLFPILAQAIAFPEIRAAVSPYVKNRARWMPRFLGHAAEHAGIEDLQAFVAPHARYLGSSEYAAANATIISRIARERDGFEALDHAARSLPGYDRDAILTAGFTHVTTDKRLGNLAWELTNAGGIQTRLGENSNLIVDLEPGVSGVIARRDLPVSPGATYLLVHEAEDTGDTRPERLRWRAQCASGPNVTKVVDFEVPLRQSATRFIAKISIPSNCSLFRLNLSGNGPDAQLPARFEISRLKLNKI
jgi:hypothetical protein